MAVARFIFGPPIYHGNARGSTALIVSSCSIEKLSSRTKTVGADQFTNVQANFLDVLNTDDSSLGSCVEEKKYCVSLNVDSSEGLISSAQSLFLFCGPE